MHNIDGCTVYGTFVPPLRHLWCLLCLCHAYTTDDAFPLFLETTSWVARLRYARYEHCLGELGFHAMTSQLSLQLLSKTLAANDTVFEVGSVAQEAHVKQVEKMRGGDCFWCCFRGNLAWSRGKFGEFMWFPRFDERCNDVRQEFLWPRILSTPCWCIDVMPQAYFISEGSLMYAWGDQKVTFNEKDKLGWLVEMCLWTPWVHVGELSTRSVSCVETIQLEPFFECICRSLDVLRLAQEYAESFVKSMNSLAAVTDLWHPDQDVDKSDSLPPKVPKISLFPRDLSSVVPLQ